MSLEIALPTQFPFTLLRFNAVPVTEGMYYSSVAYAVDGWLRAH